MIARPKLPSVLPSIDAPELVKALALEGVEVSLDWSGLSAARVTLDTVSLLEPDLTGTRLRESGWADVRVARGQLGGSDLTGASWRRIEVTAARLSGTIFAEAELKDVTFTDCKFDLANFRLATLTRVHFVRCHLLDADFAGAKLVDVRFSGCELTRADFSGAVMKSVDFPTSQLSDLRGIGGLSGSTLTHEQIIQLAPELAATLGINLLQK